MTRRFIVLFAGTFAAVACQREHTTLTVRLVDPKPLGPVHWVTPEASATYAVEVARVPVRTQDGPSFQDWVRHLLGADRPDTVPGIRVAFRPAVVNDSLVAGLGLTPGAGFNVFTYVAATREVRRSPAPDWFNREVATDLAMPAFSPGGRYLAHVARTRDDSVEAVVRSWPDGRVLARGPRGTLPPRRFPAPARAAWTDSVGFAVVYDVILSRDIARISLRGRVGDSLLRVDSVSWFPYLDSVRAAAVAEAAAAEDAQRAALAAAERLLDSSSHRVPRLSVARFRQLPAAFARELDSLGCAVPQTYFESAPHNVIRGSFGARGQEDWAVLCSRAGESVILVHWGGPAQCDRQLRPQGDRGYLIALDTVRVGYSRRITTTDHYHDYSAPNEAVKDVPLQHEAIDEYYLEKASTVWFCTGGKWLALAGVD